MGKRRLRPVQITRGSLPQGCLDMPTGDGLFPTGTTLQRTEFVYRSLRPEPPAGCHAGSAAVQSKLQPKFTLFDWQTAQSAKADGAGGKVGVPVGFEASSILRHSHLLPDSKWQGAAKLIITPPPEPCHGTVDPIDQKRKLLFVVVGDGQKRTFSGWDFYWHHEHVSLCQSTRGRKQCRMVIKPMILRRFRR
ncbi:unnamed protein product [Effrenium voratum]|nr:unnamed protein product [Effrenium voratum]